MDNTQKLELKVQALLERVSSLTSNYENQIADLRVEITTLVQELQRLSEESNNGEDADEASEEDADDVEG